jgi:GntR family transcriptional regulator/MocR family aminotransferase
VVIEKCHFCYYEPVHLQIAIILDPSSSLPLHRQIYEEWRQGILRGRFSRGERVPSTRELAGALAVSRSTVTVAYDQLAAEGYLETAHGAGTFVCRELPDESLTPANGRSGGATGTKIGLSQFGIRIADDPGLPPTPSGVINLSLPGPDIDHFPFALWRKLLNRHLRQPKNAVFSYAKEAGGYEPLRREIASYVARSRAVRCTPEQVIVVNGSQQALDLCVRLLLDPGDEVAIEDPGYQGARRILAAVGARLRLARIDSDGIVIGDLGKKARLIYVTPSHQFPTGVSMSLARRLELLEWARGHGAVLIEDDYDSEYRYTGPPLPAMQGMASGAGVVYIGTFSKVMFPGLRVGYIIVPLQLVEPFTRAKWLADRSTPVLDQAALADFLREGHLERHIRRMRRIYGRRREVLTESLHRHFGERARVLGDAAGMHLMVRFEDCGIFASAARNNVYLADSGAYYLGEAPPGEYVFVFSRVGERTIREGVKRLAD